MHPRDQLQDTLKKLENSLALLRNQPLTSGQDYIHRVNAIVKLMNTAENTLTEAAKQSITFPSVINTFLADVNGIPRTLSLTQHQSDQLKLIINQHLAKTKELQEDYEALEADELTVEYAKKLLSSFASTTNEVRDYANEWCKQFRHLVSNLMTEVSSLKETISDKEKWLRESAYNIEQQQRQLNLPVIINDEAPRKSLPIELEDCFSKDKDISSVASYAADIANVASHLLQIPTTANNAAVQAKMKKLIDDFVKEFHLKDNLSTFQKPNTASPNSIASSQANKIETKSLPSQFSASDDILTQVLEISAREFKSSLNPSPESKLETKDNPLPVISPVEILETSSLSAQQSQGLLSSSASPSRHENKHAEPSVILVNPADLSSTSAISQPQVEIADEEHDGKPGVLLPAVNLLTRFHIHQQPAAGSNTSEQPEVTNILTASRLGNL